MKIQTKITAVVFAAVFLCAAAVSASILLLERRHLAVAVEARTQLIADAMAKTAFESLLDKDDLMPLSHLRLLLSVHPELLAARVTGRAGPIEVGAKELPASEEPRTVVRRILLPSGRGVAAAEMTVELRFSGRRLKAEVRGALTQSLLRVLGLVLVLALLAGAASLVLGRQLTRPFEALSEALERIGRGSLGTQVLGLRGGELGKLAGKLNDMSRRLLEADRMKKDFVASVSHEIRSPLTAMESYVRMLRDENGLQPAQKAHLNRLNENLARLSQLMTNLLEAARIERGKFDHKPEETDLAKLVDEAVVFLGPRVRESGLNLSARIEPRLPLAWADPERVQQVLLNLLTNAVKYTPRGGTVRIALARGPETGLLCQVSDSGPGLSPEEAARLFVPFSRGSPPVKAVGVGLGLSIARSIVERHGGRIGVESQKGQGSCFWFTVPTAEEGRPEGA